MQFQADISDCKVVRPKVVETTALGASYLAGLTCGYFNDLADIEANAQTDRTFAPTFDEAKRQALLLGWEEAIGKAKYR